VLGSGGFGKVVLARHDASGNQVAIKYLRGDLLADPDFAPLFRAEAAVLASLDDPNVVRLFEYVESPAGAAIVMELVDGITLRDILARQGKTTAEAALVVLQGSLLGLAAAHRRGVVHRDYKPENVLIDGAGASKLTDFGIAARAGDSPIPAGTLAYAPPEQFTGSPASPATDVYAATATFYECLTGRPPFAGKTAEALLRQHQAEPVPLEPVPEPLRPLVAAGLAKDASRRPADGAALVTELRAVAGAAYGPDWEARGRSALAATALLLAALWPASALWPAGGGAAAAHGAAAQGTATHLVRLRRLLRLRHLRPRHIGPVKGAVAAGTAIAVGAVVVVATHHGRPAEPVNASFTVTGVLGGAAATSAGNAWTVGCADTSCSRPLILRWSGTGWTRVPAPDLGTDYNLSSVAAASADNAWAVGWAGSGTSDQTNSRTVILHWNGRTWTRVPSPSPARDNMLLRVSVTATGNAWAYGITESGLPATGDTELILHWNGTAWTQVPVPIGDPTKGWIYDVTAVSADSAWAVGSLTDAARLSVTLILRWNGSSWTRVPSPSPGENAFLTVVGAASADNAWAAGYTRANTTLRGLVFMHWNGSTWTTAPGPDLADSVLADSVFTGTAVASDGTAWVVGWIAPGASNGNANGRADTTLILRWNGTTWTRVPSPSPGPSGRLSGVTIISSSDAWATGPVDGKTLILRWNGQTWSGPAGQVSPATAPASSAVPSAASSTLSSPSSSAAASPTLAPRRQAAQALAALLAQSGADRTAVTQAVGAVAACSPGLSQDETIFSNAVSSHQALLGKLAALPGRSALPAPMLADLTAAWQASSQADQDFATWAQDEISHGCSTSYQSDTGYQAAAAPDKQATKDKQAFAAQWAGIAGEYGLPLYQYNQI
jgi:serine/threonine-protein kinase